MTMTVAGARETVGGQVVQQYGIQCFNYKEFSHFAKECRKPKRVKDSTYHKEKMLLCKQAEKGSQLQAEQSVWLPDTDEEINEQEYNVFANVIQHSEQSESISNTCVVETGDINVIPNSPDMCDNDIQNDQNAVDCDDERVALANLIANLKLDVDENKKIQKQLKKVNASLTQELIECKSILAETSRTLGESNSIRDSCLVALQNKQTEFQRYKNLNDRTIDYEKLEHKLNETLGLLAQKDIDIKEGLNLKAYKISVVKEKHDELVKQSLLTKSHYEGLVKEKTKTIHMLAPKCPTFNGRPTFVNPMYLKKAQYEKPCLYEIPHDQSDPANRLVPDREETLTLERESRSKLNKDLVKPYDYTKLNSLYEIFKPPTQEYLVQLAHANEIRKKMWRKSFVKTKPNICKNIDFLPVSKSISKSRQAYNVMTNNINHLRELVNQVWVKHSKDHFLAQTAHDMEILIKTCLMPLALKTHNDSFAFVHELKQEMHADLKYVESLKKEIDELESDKAKFSNMYDMLLQEFKECECLAQKLSKQTEFVSKEVYTELLQSFAKLDKHSISLELALQQCQEQLKNDTVYKEKVSNVFLKEHEQYFEIQDLKTKLKDKDISICKPAPFSNSLETKHFSKTKLVPKTNVLEGVNHRTNVSRPHLKSNKMKEKAVPNTSQVKFKKTEVEDHHRISSIFNQSKSVTVCNDTLKSRTSNVNAVCATCGKCVFNSNHDACISKYLHDVNARTKKPNVVPIRNRKPKSQTNKSVATYCKKTVASETTV
ncbi:hypothetical protein Tco_0436167 [Tanacetum coccineum]